MLDDIAAFAADLTRRFPGTSTAVHYVSDVRVFLRWLGRPPTEVQRCAEESPRSGASASGTG